MLKKWIARLVTMTMVVGLLSGCGSAKTEVAESSANEKLSIVTTIFPIYDWTTEILGDNMENVDITMLLDDGVDVHSYQATADDMIAIAECDLFIYVGGDSDFWVEDALKNAKNPNMQVINLVETLGDAAKVEEVIEGMEHVHEHDEEDHDHEVAVVEEDHDHDHEEEAVVEEEHEHDHDEECTEEDCEEDHDHDEECTDEECDHDHGEIDEHVWLSLRNAEVLCSVIADALIALDGDNADGYAANLDAYIAELQVMDAAYGEVVAAATYNTVLFGDRFPFRYLVDDYHLDYYAAFTGCSAETEASFETITFLAGKMDELELPVVLTIEGATHKIAETVVASTQNKDQAILIMHSMQSVTASNIAEGATYLSIMEENLQVLAEALA